MGRQCSLGVIPGKVHHCSEFSLFVHNGSHRGSLEPQSLRNGFVTPDVNDFLSQLFVLDCGLMCFLGSFFFFRSFNLLQFVRRVLFKCLFDSRDLAVNGPKSSWGKWTQPWLKCGYLQLIHDLTRGGGLLFHIGHLAMVVTLNVDPVKT